MKRILVIDDDEDILAIVSYLLRLNSFEVKTHSTGFNVPDIVLQFKPDLIVLDINLPGKQGTEICKDLKQLYSELPIILFSAHADKEQATKKSEANDFIRKPFDINVLLGCINLHLTHRVNQINRA